MIFTFGVLPQGIRRNPFTGDSY